MNRSTSLTLPAALVALTILVPAGLQGQDAAGPQSVDHDVTITVNEIAEIRLTGAAAPTFTITAPAIGGDPPVISEDTADRHLRLTSIVSNGETRTIQASHDGDVPDALDLNLLLAATVGAGNEGTTGSRESAELLLTDVPQDAVTGIGSGYTGTEATSGWKFNYSLTINDVSLLEAESNTVTVTYTLTAGG